MSFKNNVFITLLVLTLSFVLILPSSAQDIQCVVEGEYEEGTMFEYQYDAVGNIVKKAIYKPPVADFTFPAEPGVERDNVEFFDNSVANPLPTTWFWDFGDGYMSTQKDPKHAFTYAGTYSVIAKVSNPCGSDTISKEIVILPCPNHRVQVVGANTRIYNSLIEAYNSSVDGDIIQSQAVDFPEGFTVNKSIDFQGGYSCHYVEIVGRTVVHSTMTIQNGTVRMGNFGIASVLYCPDRIVKVIGANPGEHGTLDAAYTAAADGDTIQSQGVEFAENLTISKSLTFEGGFHCDTTHVVGATVLKGDMVIDNGTVILSDFVIEKLTPIN